MEYNLLNTACINRLCQPAGINRQSHYKPLETEIVLPFSNNSLTLFYADELIRLGYLNHISSPTDAHEGKL